jgi:endogenous inhibitor of DNA gyrase (YacG/DUF329 family)
MYCPKCGQQQISEEMRFCSRCGLALSGLAEWLAGGRVLPAQQNELVPHKEDVAALSPRRKGIRRAAKLMFFSGVLFPVFAIFSIAVDEGGPMVIPCMLFFISLVMMLYARLFSDKTAPANYQAPQTSALGSAQPHASLLAAPNTPIPAVGRQQVRTNELAQPPSVTENTTRLLDNE